MRPADTLEMNRGPFARTAVSGVRDGSAAGAYWMLESQLTVPPADRDRPDRAPQMPLLGLLSGLTLALVLWSGIAWVALNLVR